MKINFLKALKVVIGPMDSKYGYSSENLTQFFYEMFYIDPITRRFDGDGSVGNEQILSLVTETLLLMDNYKQFVKLKYQGFFTPSELAFIFQHFNGKLIDYLKVNILSHHSQFLEDFDSYGYEKFPEKNEAEEFRKKITSMYPFEFLILGTLIIEDWEKIPVPVLNGKNNLFDDLIGNSSEND